MLRLVGSVTAEATSLTARGRDEQDLDALRCVFRERSSDAQRFIIGMSEDGHQPERPVRSHRHRGPSLHPLRSVFVPDAASVS